MDHTVTIPTWLFVLILLFAAITFATHFLNPTVRWFLRRRMERAVAQLNQRLEVPIQPFKLAYRHDTILRLIHDPEVTRAVAVHARETGMREDVALSLARKYAREIVPSFSAAAYFGFAIRVARWLSNSLFRVRVEPGQADMLRRIDPDATIIFVMNHRSNMDYVLVTWLAGDRSALSYAVGEWARVWPLSVLIRAMGAFFIRRRSRNNLYRQVLARYVQISTQAGVTQAMFPEGRLSLSGEVAAARIGLLNYIVEGQSAPERRPVVFVPVALNYDQVLEDRILVGAAARGDRRFRGAFVTNGLMVLRWAILRLGGWGRRFGFAAVAFGEPLALDDVPGVDAQDRVKALSRALMGRLRAAVPVLPVPLVCLVLHRSGGPVPEDVLMARVAALRARVQGQGPGAPMCLEDGDDPLDLLRRRELVRAAPGGIEIVPGQEAMVAYYAASVAHHLPDVAPDEDAAVQERETEKT